MSMGRQSNDPAIVIIGSGFSGLCMAIQLKQAGYPDFVILEKNDDLGGTWRDNRYPGCACDVPSPLYSYSYELNPSWTHLFAPQREIWDYLRRCARKYGVDTHIRYCCGVQRMDWDEEAGCWHITTGPGGYRARAVVAAGGALHRPSYPDIPGRTAFSGTAFHSARWDHGADLTGKQVAVIGTGASAIQFIPEIAGRPARLRVFQRSAPWLHPRPDTTIPTRVRDTLAAAPLAALARQHLSHQVTDPVLRAKLTPDYTIGCKRILLSSSYYPALQRPNVDLITDRISEITPAGV